MNIVCINILNDCLDGSASREFVFNYKISKNVFNLLCVLGKFEYYEFAKPFFKIFYNENFIVKGVIGDNKLRIIILNKYFINEAIGIITDLINSVSEDLWVKN